MPLYEYQCDACAHRFEVIQRYSDHPIDTCPKCGGVVRKLLSSPAIQFKGTGWYITDYARSGKSDAGRSESKSEGATTPASKTDKPSESTSGTETKTDTKSEAKPASSPKSDN